MISYSWELNDWIPIIFSPRSQKNWNNICVISLKACAENLEPWNSTVKSLGHFQTVHPSPPTQNNAPYTRAHPR